MVGKGQVLRIPSNVPHRAVALEDTLDLDIFSPIREDWLKKDDAYLRREETDGLGLKDRVAIVAASSQGLGKRWRWDWRAKAPSWRCVRARNRLWKPRRRRSARKREWKC